jgi:hypothetical protein
MKRAEKARWERAAEERAREAAEELALKVLLGRRFPDSEHLVRAMKHPLFLTELRARGGGPTGVTYTSDVVRRYARVIGGDAQAVKQHFTQLIGKEQAGKLGINVGKLKISDRPAPRFGTTVDIELLSDHDVVVIAEYLASPGYLDLGNLPPNPFGSPRIANLMNNIKVLQQEAKRAPSHPYTLSGGPTVHELHYRIGKIVSIVAYEISRGMPDNAAREAALKAMRLGECLRIYTPRVVRRTGWQDIQAYETDPGTGQPEPVTRRIAVYGTVPGTPEEPTRYMVLDLKAVVARFLNWYDT